MVARTPAASGAPVVPGLSFRTYAGPADVSKELSRMVASGTATGTAQIGVTGLAVMGRNLARNFARNGYTVAIHNRSYAKTESLVADHGDDGDFVPSESVEPEPSNVHARNVHDDVNAATGARLDTLAVKLSILIVTGNVVAVDDNAACTPGDPATCNVASLSVCVNCGVTGAAFPSSHNDAVTVVGDASTNRARTRYFVPGAYVRPGTNTSAPTATSVLVPNNLNTPRKI